MKKFKKPWEKPSLIVLSRSNEQESVLCSCKTGACMSASGNHYNSCIAKGDYKHGHWKNCSGNCRTQDNS